jgi:hypothetical protein
MTALRRSTDAGRAPIPAVSRQRAVTADEYRARTVKTTPEAELQANVAELATVLRLRYFHDHDSVRNAAGFLDTVLAGPGGHAFAELKRHGGRIRPEQEKWIATLRDGGAHVYLWRPADWQSGEIRRVLEALARPRRRGAR